MSASSELYSIAASAQPAAAVVVGVAVVDDESLPQPTITQSKAAMPSMGQENLQTNA